MAAASPAGAAAAPKARRLPDAAHSAPLAGHTVLFGGSFNPPHVGHQLLCLYLLEGLGAAHVVLVPTATHADGKPLAPFAQRLSWLGAMARPLGARVSVSDIEQRLGGTSYTHTTLAALRSEPQHGDARWALCIGADLALDVPRWHRAQELLAAARWVVLPRGGHGIEPEAVRGALGPAALVAPVALPEVSSTDIRRRFVRGEPLTGLVPSCVIEQLQATPPPW